MRFTSVAKNTLTQFCTNTYHTSVLNRFSAFIWYITVLWYMPDNAVVRATAVGGSWDDT